MRYPVSIFTSDVFGIGVTCSSYCSRRCFSVVEVYRFLKHEKILFFLFTGKTVRIEPAISLFIISRPAVDAIVRK